ncbi:MAG: aminoacyl--tRNA ligase-related protein, partial [Deltaproteobacteria bacterium]
MRVSQLLLPTVKEDPAGAEAVRHKLMVRAGLVRQLAAGIYVYLPAGWRVMRKIEQIIREEMDAIGCQEMLMPVMQPAEIWQESGRWDAIGGEMFRLKDRKGADMALAMTHEEVITWLAAREIHSYKQLPQLWYHIQTKERDEARPKSGILRTREFIMKDSYSLDVSEEALQESYRLHIGAYDRIYRRCGLEFMMVE